MIDITATTGSITVTEERGRTVAHLRGEIDEALRAQAGAAMARLLARELPVVLDTSGVTFIDSTGIAFLIQCARYGREQGLPVTLADPPPAVTGVLLLIGAEQIFGPLTGGDEPR